MALIQWNNDLSVNVKEIDTQHQNLIRMINELFDAMKVGKGTEVLGKIFLQLTNYTKTHFQTEEKYSNGSITRTQKRTWQNTRNFWTRSAN